MSGQYCIACRSSQKKYSPDKALLGLMVAITTEGPGYLSTCIAELCDRHLQLFLHAVDERLKVSLKDDDSMGNKWVACKGCGKPLGLFPDGYYPDGYKTSLPPNSVGHVKGESGKIDCTLYKSMTAETLIWLHKDEPAIDPPDSFKPMVN